MRLFIALPLQSHTLDTVLRMQADLQRAGPGATLKWTRPGAIHLTLHFLGETAPDRLAALQPALREHLRPLRAPELTVTGAGAFPDWRRARVLWAGVDGGAPLPALHAAAGAALRAAGFEPELRGFTPHVTLARAGPAGCPPAVRDAAQALGGGGGPPVAHPRVVLFESRLAPAGATYLERAVFELEPAAP